MSTKIQMMNGTRKPLKRINKPKKYRCIVKIGNNPDGSAKCVKYRSSDLLKFTGFIDRKYPDWCWMNVFLRETGVQVMNFTRYRKPVSKNG